MQLYSSSIKMVKQIGLGGMISCPVFGDHDRVEGKVILDPNCSQNGRLNISVSLMRRVIQVNSITIATVDRRRV